MTLQPPDGNTAAVDDISRTELLPFLISFRDMRKRAFLWPGVTSAAFVAALLTLAAIKNEAAFLWVLAMFVWLADIYLVYLWCGRKQPFVYVLGIAAAAFVLDVLLAPLIVRIEHALPTAIAPGLVEEPAKALPLGLVLLVTWKLSHRVQRAYGLREPLDGILLGAASASGFAFLETMFIYVPHYGVLIGAPRLLDACFGHIAYSGAFGYFIGLAALHHRNRRRAALAVLVGFLVANLLHDLWDSVQFYTGGFAVVGPVQEVLVAAMSFVVLASVILKGREVSPEREFLWPYGSILPYRAPEVEPLPPMAVLAGDLWLQIGSNRVRLAEDGAVTVRDIPALHACATDGVVGEVRRHPTDPALLVLRNVSTARWQAVLPDGTVRTVPPAGTVRLLPGTRLDFGVQHGAITITAHDPDGDPPPRGEDEWC